MLDGGGHNSKIHVKNEYTKLRVYFFKYMHHEIGWETRVKGVWELITEHLLVVCIFYCNIFNLEHPDYVSQVYTDPSDVKYVDIVKVWTYNRYCCRNRNYPLQTDEEKWDAIMIFVVKILYLQC